jgi:hypothetical protein
MEMWLCLCLHVALCIDSFIQSFAVIHNTASQEEREEKRREMPSFLLFRGDFSLFLFSMEKQHHTAPDTYLLSTDPYLNI